MNHTIKGKEEVLHVVDFGSGAGNSSLVFAKLYPTVRFTLVDSKPECVRLIEERVHTSKLTNVATFLGDLRDYKTSFDIGLAIHLCGEATDIAQQACVNNSASFILVPCCVGKINKVVESQLQNHNDSSTPIYPRSTWLRGKIDTHNYLAFTRLADYSDGGGNKTLDTKGGIAKALIDIDRAKFGEEEKYEIEIGKMVPKEASVKNDVIVGRFRY